MAIHFPQDTQGLLMTFFLFFFPYQLVWCLCCQYECDYLSLCCLDMLIPSLSNKSCLQCWNLSLNLVQDPPCPLCTRESKCCSQCPQLERFSDYSDLKTAKKCTKDPTMPSSIAGSGPKMPFCHQWPTAVSGLECRKDSKEVMGKSVLAVMDSSIVFTCLLLPGN